MNPDADTAETPTSTGSIVSTESPALGISTVPPDDVADLLEELIRCDSSNPDLVPDAPGEGRIADLISAWLGSRGFTCHRLESRPGRPSIVAVAPGTGGGKSIMLNGHVDTVSLASYDGDGLTPVRKDGKIFGRGGFDMKCGIAASMVAAVAATQEPLRGDVILALVADEEFASAGTEEVLRSFSADAAIVVEPTGLELMIAHGGFAWVDVTIHGVAAHGSLPEVGVDAITKAGKFLVELERLGDRLAKGERHPLVGTGSIHASLITGGEEYSSYPASCTISLERRTIPGEDAATSERELREILDALAAADSTFKYDMRQRMSRSTFSVDREASIVRTVAAQLAQDTGQVATFGGGPFWTDCALLAGAGIPTVLFGASGDGAHAAEEWVDISSLRTVTRVLEQTIREHCK